MKRIANLVVTENGFTDVVAKGTVLWLENKITGEQIVVEVDAADKNVIVAHSQADGNILTLSVAAFSSTFDVIGISQVSADVHIAKAATELKTNIDKAVAELSSNESVQKAKEVGEKAVAAGKKSLISILGTTADFLQKAGTHLSEAVAEVEKEEEKE